MGRLVRCLILAVIASACSSGGLGSPGASGEPSLATSAARAEAVEAIDRHVRRYFAHWEVVPELDYPAALADFREAALSAEGRREFAFETMRFLALLGNGHTDAGDAQIWRDLGAPFPFTLRHAEGEWVVAWSRDDRLAAGDVVREIEGESFESFYQEARRYISASTGHSARRRLGSRYFLFPEQFELVLADGRRVEVARKASPPAPVPAEGRPAVEWVPHRWLVADSIALLRLSTFGRGAVEDRALELLSSEIGRAPSLVLDLRANGGGNTPWTAAKGAPPGSGRARLAVADDRGQHPCVVPDAGGRSHRASALIRRRAGRDRSSCSWMAGGCPRVRTS